MDKGHDRILQELGGHQFISDRLDSSLSWLEKSMAICDHNGSSAYMTLWGRWADPYAETTGYLIPTLLQASKLSGKSQLEEPANQQATWLMSLQSQQGYYKTAFDKDEAFVFDTAQIVLGLLSLYQENNNTALLDSAHSAVAWLESHLDEEGCFVSYNYVRDYNPAYYARIAWPMLAYYKLAQKSPSIQTLALYNRLIQLRQENGSYLQWGFHPDQAAYTHTIAYTLRGLYECSKIIEDNKTLQQVISSCDILANKILSDGIAGSYTTEWKGDHKYICSVGSAQLAILYLKRYQENPKPTYLDCITTLLKPLLKAQCQWPHKGALPGSIPLWGPYQRAKYTNWTQKFYCDALMGIIDKTGKES